MQAACQAYRAYLKDLQSAPYVIQAVAFWAIELCYNQAWGAVLQEGQGAELQEFAHRYGEQMSRCTPVGIMDGKQTNVDVKQMHVPVFFKYVRIAPPTDKRWKQARESRDRVVDCGCCL
jgi:hypothetical protein